MTDDKNTSTDLAVRSSTDLAAVEDLKKLLLSGDLEVGDEVIEDPEVIKREIMTQLLYAESDDEVLNRSEAIGLRTLARRFARHHGLELSDGVPLELHWFKWRKSDFEGEGLPIYFILSATRLDTGDRVVVTTGSTNVVAQVVNMAERGTLDGVKVLCTESEKPSKSGNYPMWLVRPPVAAARPAPAEASAA